MTVFFDTAWYSTPTFDEIVANKKIYYVAPRNTSPQEVREAVQLAIGKSVLVTHLERDMYRDQLGDVIDEADMMGDNGKWKQWWLNCVTGWQLSPSGEHQKGEQPWEEALERLVDWLRGYPLSGLEFSSHDVVHEKLEDEFDHLYVDIPFHIFELLDFI